MQEHGELTASNSPSNKRKIIGIALFATLLITALTGALLLKVGLANTDPNLANVPNKLPPPDPATIDILNPESGVFYKRNGVNLRVSVANLSDIYKIYCYLDGQVILVPQKPSFTIYLSDLSDGDHSIKISVSNQKKPQLSKYYYYDFKRGIPTSWLLATLDAVILFGVILKSVSLLIVLRRELLFYLLRNDLTVPRWFLTLRWTSLFRKQHTVWTDRRT